MRRNLALDEPELRRYGRHVKFAGVPEAWADWKGIGGRGGNVHVWNAAAAYVISAWWIVVVSRHVLAV